MFKIDTIQTLRAIRNKLDLSQEQLAARLNVSFATVNRWEAGKSKPQKAQALAIEALVEEAGLAATDDAGAAAGSSGRRRRGVQKSSVLGNKSMEQMLWDAACSIRGEKDAPKFKDYLLPLLFVKRLSDVFDDEIQRLAEQFDDRDAALEVLEADHSLVRFYLPPEARWGVVSGRVAFGWPVEKQPKTLGEQLTTTIRAIVKHNPPLAGVIDTVDFNETRNGEREISDTALKGVIETFSDPRYRLGLHDVEPDFLGRCYEYLLRKFAEGQATSAGEFFTPTEVGFLIAEIMRPRPGEECYDYACGSFGLLIKLQLASRRLDPLSRVPLKLFGQELTGSSYAIACMNKIIHDMEGEVVRGDSMRNPKFRDGDNRLKHFDVVVANPMWMQQFDSDVYENDPFERFEQNGGITTSKGDWAWLEHTLASLKDSGRAAVVIDPGAVTRGSGSKNEDKERNIRKWFVEHDFVEGVILLPDNLFYNTTAAGIIIVLRKNKSRDRRGKIVLVNASREFKKGMPKNYLTNEAITKIADTFKKGTTADGFSAVITNEDAAKKDFNLSPSTYITTVNGDGPRRSIEELVVALEEIERESNKVEGALQEALAQLSSTRVASTATRWPTTTIDKLFDIGSGKSVTPASRHGEPKNPFLRTANVLWGRIDLSEVDAMHFSAEELKTKTLRKGDLLVCEGGDIGRSAIWIGGIENCSFQNHLHRLRPKSTEVVPQFYMYFLQAGFTQFGIYEGAGNKTTIPNLSRNRLGALEVPKLNRDEQEKIAAALQMAQRAAEIHERKRVAFQELFQMLLHKLMSGEIGVGGLNIDTSGVVNE